jgi:hypothetical protein
MDLDGRVLSQGRNLVVVFVALPDNPSGFKSVIGREFEGLKNNSAFSANPD